MDANNTITQQTAESAPALGKPTITREQFNADLKVIVSWLPYVLFDGIEAEEANRIRAYADQQDARIAILEEQVKQTDVQLAKALEDYADAIDALTTEHKAGYSDGYGAARNSAKEHYASKMSKEVAEKVRERLADAANGYELRPRTIAIIDSLTED